MSALPAVRKRDNASVACASLPLPALAAPLSLPARCLPGCLPAMLLLLLHVAQ